MAPLASAPRTVAGTVAPARVRAATGLRASVVKGASVPRDAVTKPRPRARTRPSVASAVSEGARSNDRCRATEDWIT